MKKSHLLFRKDLQGLRAIAITFVILAHSGLNILPGGFIGVDVFFVLSGYLITTLLLKEYNQTGKIAFARFYTRRLRRLSPALIAVVIISLMLAIWVIPAPDLLSQLKSLQYVVTWTSNLYFALSEIDYFNDVINQNIFLHTT